MSSSSAIEAAPPVARATGNRHRAGVTLTQASTQRIVFAVPTLAPSSLPKARTQGELVTGHAFFFSSARSDWRACVDRNPMNPNRDKNYVDSLFEELKASVQVKLGCALELTGYRDYNELRTGDIWSKELAKAACLSKVIVALISPNYLKSLNCGREFAVFQRRFELIENANFYHIIPIYWESSINCSYHIPEKVRPHFSDVQQYGPDLPEGYPAVIGLYDVWRMKSQQDRNKIVITAADRIVSMIRECELPPLEGFDRFHELPSAFEQTEADQERADAAKRPLNLADQPAEIRAPGRPLPVLAPA